MRQKSEGPRWKKWVGWELGHIRGQLLGMRGAEDEQDLVVLSRRGPYSGGKAHGAGGDLEDPAGSAIPAPPLLWNLLSRVDFLRL